MENPAGLRIRSFWDGHETVCTWTPRPEHGATPDFLNGGVVATLIDCHSVITATATAYRKAGRDLGSDPQIGFVSRSLKVDYLRPTPLAGDVTLRARVTDLGDRRATVACSLYSEQGKECARGELEAIQVAPPRDRDG